MVNRSHPMTCCQREELVASRIEERISGGDKRTNLVSSHSCKRFVDLIFVAGPKDKNFSSERTGSNLRGSHLGIAGRVVRIY